MKLSFKVVERIKDLVPGEVQLRTNNWDDYTFKTSFEVALLDAKGARLDLGTVKIGYQGQTGGRTVDKMDLAPFVNLQIECNSAN